MKTVIVPKQPTQAVLYVRVSSKEQEKGGFSDTGPIEIASCNMVKPKGSPSSKNFSGR